MFLSAQAKIYEKTFEGNLYSWNNNYVLMNANAFEQTQLDFGVNKPPYAMGDRVQVVVNSQPKNNVYSVLQYLMLHNNDKDVVVNDVTNMTSITYLFGGCINSTVTLDMVQKQWFDQDTRDTKLPCYNTMQNQFRICTNNKVSFTKDNNLIIGPIPMPCSGTFTRNTITYKYDIGQKCGYTELYALGVVANAYTAMNYPDVNANLPYFKRKIYLIPGMKCPWSGLGSMECRTGCSIHALGLDIGVIFHEMMHTLGLRHASRIYSKGNYGEYDDVTDVMGTGGSSTNNDVCFNSAWSYKAGWASAIDTIDFNTMSPMKDMPYTLPSMHLSSNNVVRVVINGSNTPLPRVIYVSLRSRGNKTPIGTCDRDNGLKVPMTKKVYVHELISGSELPAASNSVLHAVLDIKNSTVKLGAEPFKISPIFSLKVSNDYLVIRVLSIQSIAGVQAPVEASFAQIAICRTDVLKESNCNDGIDNDCDGLVDMKDPDCKADL